MKKELDVRILRLNKWYVPKSVDLRQEEIKVVLGYFDAFDVQALDETIDLDKIHPFTAGYEKLVKQKLSQKKNLVDFSSQEQMLFLNLSEDGCLDGTTFAQEDVKKFWDDIDDFESKFEYPYIYLSMLHINHSKQLEKTLKKIKTVFEKDYLSYVSFDYCDIVIFAQNMHIREYLDKIKKLFIVDADSNNPIFDTFSMVSFRSKDSCKKSEDMLTLSVDKADDVDNFYATINLSIRDHGKFRQWYQEVLGNEKLKIKLYNLYGRNDISIINENADTKWLLSMMDSLHKEENQKMCWTFETFIKVAFDEKDSMEMTSDLPGHLERDYTAIRDFLQIKTTEFEKAVTKTKFRNKEKYILPVYEVRDCICSIVKNKFAEEFICCIYESFLHFVEYMKDVFDRAAELSEENEDLEKDIAESYDKYFVALNTLVNSTMHNDRQFVQATAFNAIFCSVPPKIIAFYNAYIFRIQHILTNRQSNNRYTFLIYPSFSPTISLAQISLDDKPPCNRVLTVTVSEKTLYDIEAVMYQMVHELAHYVGSDLRCRAERRQKIEHTLVKWIMDRCGIQEDSYELIQEWLNQNRSKEDDFMYLQYIRKQGGYILQTLTDADKYSKVAEAFYREQLKTEEDFNDVFLEDIGIDKKYQRIYIENYPEQYAEIKYRHFFVGINKMNTPERAQRYMEYMKLIKSVYRECYADLQMILVLAMRAEDYLDTFLIGQGLSMQEIQDQTEDMIRISTVFRVMIDVGLWEKPAGADSRSYRNAYELLDEYNQQVIAGTEEDRIVESRAKAKRVSDIAKLYDFKDGIKLKKRLAEEDGSSSDPEPDNSQIIALPDLAADLYDYLLEVMEKSIQKYFDNTPNNKRSKILNMRKLVKQILNSRDIMEIFTCVESELEHYKKMGYRISGI